MTALELFGVMLPFCVTLGALAYLSLNQGARKSKPKFREFPSVARKWVLRQAHH